MSARSMKRVALVTGCSSGLGLLSALELAKAGCRVFASMRTIEKRAALDRAAAAAGVDPDVVSLDVTKPNSIVQALDQIAELAGPVDVLVNNAGIETWGTVEEQSLDETRAQLETNFFGTVALIRAVLPSMRDRGWGRIVNVSSINGRVAVPMLAGYVASKFAVEGFSEALRLEVASEGVFVSLIEPGGFWTEMFTENRRFATGSTSASRDHARTRAIADRLAQMVKDSGQDPGDVARTVVRAVTARRPRLRYLVGRDAHRLARLRALLPESSFESVLRRVLFVS